MLAFLTNDGGDGWDQTKVARSGEGSLNIWKDAEDQVGEGRCECDGVFECGDRELVGAWSDRLDIEVLESAVGVEGMKLFLL